MKEINEKIDYYMEGNNLKIEEIMKKYNHYIYAILNNSNSKLSNEDIEEILLDVYLTLWNNKEKLDVNKSLSAYIGGITKNLILKKYRNSKFLENIDDYTEIISDMKDIEIDYISTQKNQIIIDELEKVKEQDKNIFILYYYEEIKVKDIATRYKMSESKVKSKLFRMRKRIKKILKERGYDFYEG